MRWNSQAVPWAASAKGSLGQSSASSQHSSISPRYQATPGTEACNLSFYTKDTVLALCRVMWAEEKLHLGTTFPRVPVWLQIKVGNKKSAGDLEGGMKQWPSGSGDQVQQQLTHAVTHAVIALLAHPGTADISWVHSRSRSDQISPSLSKPWARYTFSSVTTGTRFSRASPVGSSLEAVRVRGTFQFVPVLSHFTSNFCPRCRPCWSAEDLGPTPDTEATALHRLCCYFSYCISLISLVNPFFCVTQNSCAVPDPMLTNTTNYSHGLSKCKDLLFLLPCGSSEQLFLPASAFLVELWSLSSPPPTPLLWSPSWPRLNHHHHYQNHDYHHRFHCHHHHQNHHQLPLQSPAASTTTITPALSPWIFSHQQIHLNYSYFTNVELKPREIK